MPKVKNLLHLAITLFVSCASAGAQATRSEPERQLAHDIYKEFVEIQSGFTTGTTTPVAEAAAARLRAAGFPESDIFLGGANPKKGNLVVRYHGTGALKPILLLAHIDVVEAKREDWSMDPFQLIERDGYFYGRGTGDDKAQAAVWIANLIQYKKEGFKPDRDIIVALTADEEGGGPYNGVAWLLKNHRELIDAEFALNEGGWGESAGGRRISNDLQVSEKYVVNFRLEVHNKGGHSSMPVTDNAIYRLAAALQHLANFGFPLKTNEVTAAYFQQMAKIETGPMKEDLAKAAKGSQESMQRLAAATPAFNATLRTTCVATMLEGGHAFNALPQTARATVNCRVLPGESVEEVQTTLARVLADPEISVTPTWTHVASAPSPLNPEIMQTIERLSAEFWPSAPVIPTMSSGATDGSFLRNAGIPTYGHSGLALDIVDVRFHGKDERVPVRSFYDGLEYQYRLVKALSSGK